MAVWDEEDPEGASWDEDSPPSADWDRTESNRSFFFTNSVDAKEFQEEFEEEGFVLINASTSRRPDAIAPGLVALSHGPVEVSNTSDGLLARAWKVRASNDDETVYLSGASSDGDSWDTETELFEFSDGEDNPFVSIDFTFDQNGAVVFVAEREDGDIWVRYFDITQGGTVFQSKATGRTPVIMLDNPFDDLTSEILLFYLDAGNALKYLVQSERYDTINDASVALTADDYLEKLVLDTGYRIHLIYSSHDDVAGTWSLEWISSERYNFEEFLEEFHIEASMEAELRDLLIKHEIEVEEFDVAGALGVAPLLSAIISSYTDDDELDLTLSMADIVMDEVVIEHEIEVEEFDMEGAVISGEIVVVVVTYELEEEFDIGGATVSGVIS